MNDYRRVPSFPFWIGFAAATGFIAAAAVSLLAPVSWGAYWRYVLQQYGWQVVAAILTAATVLLISLLVTGRRKASGVLAIGMFVSIVVHMMIASLFGGVVISRPVVEAVGNDGRFEVSSGVPQLTESLLSEAMRGQFTAVSPPDLRDLAVEQKAASVPEPSRISRPQVKPADLKDRPTEAGREQAIQASGGRARLADELAAPGDRLPEVDKAPVGKAEPVKPAVEDSISRVEPRRLPEASPLRMPAVELEAPRNIPVAAVAGEAQRAPEHGNMEIGSARRGVQRQADDIQSVRAGKEKVKGLVLNAKQVHTARDSVPSRTALPDRQPAALDVTHKDMLGSDVPVPVRVSRELKRSPGGVSVASLSDAASGVESSRPRVDGAASTGISGRPKSDAQPVRMADTFRSVAASASPAVVSAVAAGAQREMAPGRGGKGAALAEDVPVALKASVQLQGQMSGEKTLAVALPGRVGSPVKEGRTVEELLLAGGRRAADAVSRAVGGRAERIEAPGAAAGLTAELPDNYYSRGIAVAKRGVEYAQWAGEQGGAPAGPALDFTASAADPAGGGSLAASDMAGVPAVFAPAPEDTFSGNASAGGRTTGLALADVGGGAAPVQMMVAVSTGATGQATAGAWKEWRGSKRQADSGWSPQGGVAAAPRKSVEADFRGAAGIDDATAGWAVADAGGGWPGVATVSAEPLPSASVKGAAGTDARQMVITAGSVRGVDRSGVEAAGDGHRDVATSAGLGFSPGKAEAEVLTPTVRGGAVSRSFEAADAQGKAARDADRVVSLADGGDEATGRRGAVRSGVAPDAVLNGKSAGNADGASRVAFGVVKREAEHAAGRGGDDATVREARAPGEMRVSKAGGMVAASAAVSRGTWLDVGSASLASHESRSHARLESGAVDGSGQGGVAALPAHGGRPGRGILLADSLAAIPATVVQKSIYTLRTPEKRKAVAREFGGSDKTEQAVESALKWLAAAQSDDGRWDVDGFRTLSRCGGPGDRSDEDVALTGLCLLSYLGAGYTHVKGEHRESIRKALDWLLEGQKADGDLQRDGQMYGQAMATAALCECYSMTGDKRLLEPIEKAVDFIARAQNPGAGWRYEPRKDSDTSVTGWQVLALKSAMIAGVRLAPEHFQWVEAWLGAVRSGREGGLYAYMPGQGATPTMTAEGWFCQLMMQEKTRMRGQGETIPYIMAHLPAWSSQENGVNLYYWYYSTLALYMSGAPEFAAWNQALVKALLAGQVKRGAAQGSWDPVCVLGARGGRVYMTATAALCLEVYYRYLPFYRQR